MGDSKAGADLENGDERYNAETRNLRDAYPIIAYLCSNVVDEALVVELTIERSAAEIGHSGQTRESGDR